MHEIDNTVLGKIILLQSTLHVQTDTINMSRFVCRGLSAIPGVESVEMYLENALVSDHKKLDIPTDQYQKLFDSLGNEFESKDKSANLIDRFKKKYDVDCLAIQTIFSLYGIISIKLSDKKTYQSYKSYIQNTLNLIGLVIENNRQKKALLDNKILLEASVKERTAELALTIEQLQWELSVNRALANLSESIINVDSSLEKVANLILQSACEVTNSKDGFVSIVDIDDETHTRLAFTDTMESIQLPPEHQQPCYHNQPGTDNPLLIKDQLLSNVMIVPARLGGKLYGQIVLANSSVSYSKKELNAITYMSNLFALAIHRKNFEDQVTASLKEKETLLQEIHHRVKNNMQVVASLLKLQSDKSKSQKVKDALSESQSRIFAMASVHENLYRSQNLDEINLKDYITTIAKKAHMTFLTRTTEVELNILIEQINLGIVVASPLGLAVNELISNAFKHAFSGREKGLVTITAKKSDDHHISISVRDNGIGMPADLDWRKSKSLGMQLVTSLIEVQLEGSVHLDNTNGTSFVIQIEI